MLGPVIGGGVFWTLIDAGQGLSTGRVYRYDLGTGHPKVVDSGDVTEPQALGDGIYLEVFDTRSGSIATTGLLDTGVAGSGYGVVYFGGALASTGGPASLRVVDTRDLPQIDC